ncbi:MAG: hypothetical protein ACXV5U_13070 [Ilumatobacteraceae bacterium]
MVNIIVDQATFEHHLATLAGAPVEPLDPATMNHRRCETPPDTNSTPPTSLEEKPHAHTP